MLLGYLHFLGLVNHDLLLESEVFDFLEMLPCARNGPHHLLRDTPNVHAGACTAKRQ